MAVLAFLLPLLAGCCLLQSALPAEGLRPRWAARMLALGLGIAAGISASSILYFLLLVAGAASSFSVIAADSLLAAAGLALVWIRRRRSPLRQPAVAGASPYRWNWLLALAFSAGFALVLSGLIGIAQATPYGEWDAWTIWNLRAKLLGGPPGAWKSALSPLFTDLHPDYPLLLPGFIAQVWRAAGAAPQWAPASVGLLFLAATLAILISALALLRGAASALLAGFVVLASTSFLYLAPMQYADLPLACYYLAAIALVLLSSQSTAYARPCLALAGFYASSAAWTKNEGLPFLAILLISTFLVAIRRSGARTALRWWTPLALGAAPVLLLVIGFKLFVAPSTEPLLHQTAGQIAHKLADAGRYAQIAKALVVEGYRFGQPFSHPLLLIAILAFALGFRVEARYAPAMRAAALTLGLVFAGYCAVYLITPSDLAWHLRTSLSRLYGQLWPAALLLIFVALKPPGQTVASKKPPAAR